MYNKIKNINLINLVDFMTNMSINVSSTSVAATSVSTPTTAVAAPKTDEISIKGNILHIPARDGHEAMDLHITGFQFGGVAKDTSKLTDYEMYALLKMAKAVIENMDSQQIPREPLSNLHIQLNPDTHSAEVTRHIGSEKFEQKAAEEVKGQKAAAPSKSLPAKFTVTGKAVAQARENIATIFEKSTRQPPLDLDHLHIDDDFEQRPRERVAVKEQAAPKTQKQVEARVAARDSTPIREDYKGKKGEFYGRETVDELIRPSDQMKQEVELVKLKEQKKEIESQLKKGVHSDALEKNLVRIDSRIQELTKSINSKGVSVLEQAENAAKETKTHLEGKKSKLESEIKKLIDSEDPTKESKIKNIAQQLDQVNADILYYSKKIEQIGEYRKNNKDWLDSNYWRDELGSIKDFNSAASRYISAPVNMRYHALTSGEKEVQTNGMMRCGVISDMRNGWYSLNDLEEMRASQNPNEIIAKRVNVVAKDLLIEEIKKFSSEEVKANKIDKYIKKLEKEVAKLQAKKEKLSPKEKEYLGKAEEILKLHELTNVSADNVVEATKALNDKISSTLVKTEKTEKEKDKIKATNEYKLRLQSFQFGLSRLGKMAENPQNIEAAFAERRRILGDQMVQLVSAQVTRNPHLVENGVFEMAHVGLLEASTHKMSKGWMHDEAVEMSDMAAIFKEFDGKTIKFKEGLSGPIVDYDEGIVYMPPPPNLSPEAIKLGKEQGIQLRSTFVNISVHGNKHDAVQKRINDDGIKNLRMNHPEQEATFQQFEKDLKVREKGRFFKGATQFDSSGYKVAENLITDLVLSKKIAVSGGCLSVKDRTGVVCGRVMQRVLEKNTSLTPETNPFATHILDENSVASKIVYKNTGVKSLKLAPLHKNINLHFHDINVKLSNRINACYRAARDKSPD